MSANGKRASAYSPVSRYKSLPAARHCDIHRIGYTLQIYLLDLHLHLSYSLAFWDGLIELLMNRKQPQH